MLTKEDSAFTCDRLQVLSLLCAQVSISIENASLYKDLQQSETREREKANQLEAALHQLQSTQLQLVQTEKMSSLGQMVAGIAHEINNPVNFIKGNCLRVQAQLRTFNIGVAQFNDFMIKSHAKTGNGFCNRCSGCAILVVPQLNHPLHPLFHPLPVSFVECATP